MNYIMHHNLTLLIPLYVPPLQNIIKLPPQLLPTISIDQTLTRQTHLLLPRTQIRNIAQRP